MAKDAISWIAENVLPYERDVRGWLQRAGAAASDGDDIVQEAYARLAAIPSVGHIKSGRTYFFVTVKNIFRERLRRERLVRIDFLAEIDTLSILDEGPTAERAIIGLQQLELVRQLIEELPERARQIFILRKVEGLSQRETAQKLGISENVVEKQVSLGLKTVLRKLAETDEIGSSARDIGLDSGQRAAGK